MGEMVWLCVGDFAILFRWWTKTIYKLHVDGAVAVGLCEHHQNALKKSYFVLELSLHALNKILVLHLRRCQKQKWMDTCLDTCIFRKTQD